MNEMPILKESDFRKEIKGSPRNTYLFFGEEDYLKLASVKLAREAICPDPAFSVFNEMRIDSQDFTPDALIDALMPLPMGADRKLIVVSGMNFSSMKKEDFDAFTDAVSNINTYDYNTLIVTVPPDGLDTKQSQNKKDDKKSDKDGKKDENKKFDPMKILPQFFTLVQFDKTSPTRLTSWVAKHFAHNGVTVTPIFCEKMISHCGTSMFVLANEIDKLSFYVLQLGKPTPTESDLKFVCTSCNEYDVFAFTNALMARKISLALDILNDYKFRRVDQTFILGDVSRTFCDMAVVQTLTKVGMSPKDINAVTGIHAFQVQLYQKSLANTDPAVLRRAIDACNKADISLKSSFSSSKPYTAVDILVSSLGA